MPEEQQYDPDLRYSETEKQKAKWKAVPMEDNRDLIESNGLTFTKELDKLLTAMNKAQGSMEVARKDSTSGVYDSNYATIKSVIEASKKPLKDNGLSLTQFVNDDALVNVLGHTSGQFIMNKKPIRCKDKNDNHKEGSGITYARRYSWMSICGIPTEDDDGKASVNKGGKAEPKQLENALKKLLETKAYPHLENAWKKHSRQWEKDLSSQDYDHVVKLKDMLKKEFKDDFAVAMEDSKEKVQKGDKVTFQKEKTPSEKVKEMKKNLESDAESDLKLVDKEDYSVEEDPVTGV